MALLSQIPLAVASKSFSRDPRLRDELAARYAHIRWNSTGRALVDLRKAVLGIVDERDSTA